MRGGEHEVARAYVLYRERRSQERAQEKSQKRGEARSRRRSSSSTTACRSRSTSTRLTALVKESCEGLRRRRARAHPQGHAQGPLQRRADGRGAQVRRARRAHADREGPGVQLRHRAPAARRASATRRSARKRRRPTWRRKLRRVLPALRQARHQDRPPERGARAVRPEGARRGVEARARPAVRLPRPADALRPLFPHRPVRRRAAASSCRSASSCAWRWASR